MQAVFKNKISGLKSFPLPFHLSETEIEIEVKEHFSAELIKFTQAKLVEGFSNKKNLTIVTNFLS